MRQQIFKIGLPVKTISAYLLCCGLEDADQTITTQQLLDIWNSSDEELDKALKDLEEKNIVKKIISDQKETNIYKLMDEKSWKTGGQ